MSYPIPDLGQRPSAEPLPLGLPRHPEPAHAHAPHRPDRSSAGAALLALIPSPAGAGTPDRLSDRAFSAIADRAAREAYAAWAASAQADATSTSLPT